MKPAAIGSASVSPFFSIKPRARVTIVDRFGAQRTGTAVMLGSAGWVLNMGGPHGTPAIASPANTVKVRQARQASK